MIPPNATGTDGEKLKLREAEARAALGSEAGQNLSDEEWQRARAKLLAFAVLLTGWARRTSTKESVNNKVATIRKAAPFEPGADQAA
jgi:hypothetical protein